MPGPATPEIDANTDAYEDHDGKPPGQESFHDRDGGRRRLGLYYNCNEKFCCGHNKVCQCLFLLEGEDDDEARGDGRPVDENPYISLHAIACVRTSETMQVRLCLGHTTQLVLLDSRSTHNFVSYAAASSTAFPLQHCASMKDIVVNEEPVPCLGVLHRADFSIDGEAFQADHFALPLGGYDVILGTQWLALLGPIRWDLGAHMMSLWHKDHCLCW